MKFRQIDNKDVSAVLTDPNLYMLFIESENKIARKKVITMPIDKIIKCLVDTRYMFGYFESEDTDGGR